MYFHDTVPLTLGKGIDDDSTCGVGWVRAGLHFIVAPEVGGEVPLAGEQLAAQRALEVGEQEQVSLLATAHLRIFSTVVTSFGDPDLIRRIRMFLGLLDPDPDPLVRCTDPSLFIYIF